MKTYRNKAKYLTLLAAAALLCTACGMDNEKATNTAVNKNSEIDTDCTDQTVKEAINENINLEDGREVESYGWLDSSQQCYRVAVKRTEDEADEYSHVEDYFFIKKDDVICVNVQYPSKKDDQDSDRYVFDFCDFSAEYTDVTFDGEKDIVISLGHQGAAGTQVHCAYIYEDNDFIYTKSFENIPNYSINEEEKCINGQYKDATYSYIYEDGAFVEK